MVLRYSASQVSPIFKTLRLVTEKKIYVNCFFFQQSVDQCSALFGIGMLYIYFIMFCLIGFQLQTKPVCQVK